MQPAELMQEARKLRWKARRRADDLFSGEYHAAYKGQGIEFDEVREYQPGDEVRSIDWNVTARTGRPFVKRFREERQLNVSLLMDCSARGVFGSMGKSKLRLAAEACGIIAIAASTNQDRVGLWTFADGPLAHVPAGGGPKQVMRILRELVAVEPRGGSAGLPETVKTVSMVQRRRSVVFILGDFVVPRDPEELESWTIALRRLARRHEVAALRLSDPRELVLPRAGLIETVDPETGRRTLLDTGSGRVRRRWAARAAADRGVAAELLRSAGVDLVELSTDRAPADDLAAYFRRRERARAKH
ncbi:MAG: DUF58 domain-containing protein [Planctomycetota bacterium]